MSEKKVTVNSKTAYITEIIAGDEDSRAKIRVEGKYVNMLVTENGYQWSGFQLNEENVDNIMAILEVYKRDFINR